MDELEYYSNESTITAEAFERFLEEKQVQCPACALRGPLQVVVRNDPEPTEGGESYATVLMTPVFKQGVKSYFDYSFAFTIITLCQNCSNVQSFLLTAVKEYLNRDR